MTTATDDPTTPHVPGTWRVWNRQGLSLHLAPSLVLWLGVLVFLFSTSRVMPPAAALVTALLSVLSILGHELGHAHAVRQCGVGPARILLAGLRSTCSWTGTATPLQRTRIALAGPAASALLTLGFMLLAALLRAQPPSALQAMAWQATSVLAMLNLAWTISNLLPVLPLDGGLALLGWLHHRNGALHVAWRRTRVVSVVVGTLCVLGLLATDWWIPALLVAALVLMGATRSPLSSDDEAAPVRTAPVPPTHA